MREFKAMKTDLRATKAKLEALQARSRSTAGAGGPLMYAAELKAEAAEVKRRMDDAEDWMRRAGPMLEGAEAAMKSDEEEEEERNLCSNESTTHSRRR